MPCFAGTCGNFIAPFTLVQQLLYFFAIYMYKKKSRYLNKCIQLVLFSDSVILDCLWTRGRLTSEATLYKICKGATTKVIVSTNLVHLIWILLMILLMGMGLRSNMWSTLTEIHIKTSEATKSMVEISPRNCLNLCSLGLMLTYLETRMLKVLSKMAAKTAWPALAGNEFQMSVFNP